MTGRIGRAFVILAMIAATGWAAGTDLFLPSVGSAPGVAPSVWYTTVWLFNPNDFGVTVELTFLRRDQDNSTPEARTSITAGPGEVRQLDDVLSTLLGVEGFGAIRAVSADEVHVMARIFSREDGESDRDSVGQFFPAIPAERAIGVGESADLIGLTNLAGGEFRYNVGFVETTGNPVQLRVELVTESGSSWVVSAIGLLPFEQRQLSVDELFNFAIGESDNFRLNVQAASGDGRAIVFGSRIANGSQDPTTFAMTRSGMP
jgi:hypothetical protein